MCHLHILYVEVDRMSKRKNNNRGKAGGANINPQGYTEDKADQQPKTELQQRAKTKNTKI